MRAGTRARETLWPLPRRFAHRPGLAFPVPTLSSFKWNVEPSGSLCTQGGSDAEVLPSLPRAADLIPEDDARRSVVGLIQNEGSFSFLQQSEKKQPTVLTTQTQTDTADVAGSSPA